MSCRHTASASPCGDAASPRRLRASSRSVGTLWISGFPVCCALQGKGGTNRIWKLRLPAKDASERPRWLAALYHHGVQGTGALASTHEGPSSTVAPNGYDYTTHRSIWEDCRTEVRACLHSPRCTKE
jgi:hypothetical protein